MKLEETVEEALNSERYWRLLLVEDPDPIVNVAIDEAVLTAVDQRKAPNTLRFWRNKKTVVLGRSQRTQEEVNLDACEKLGVSVVKRFTGGGAVYQDFGNLNWTVITRKEYLPFNSPTEIHRVFSLFGETIAEGLRRVGYDCTFKPPNSITLKGFKVSGMAAYVKSASILCHGTLLLNVDLTVMSKVLKKMKVEVANLNLKKTGKGIEDIERAIIESLSHAYKLKFKTAPLLKIEEENLRLLLSENKIYSEHRPENSRTCMIMQR